MYAWKNNDTVNHYLANTRNAIPLGAEQLDIILRLVGKSQQNVERYIDLGCGDGVLAHTLLNQYPNAHGVLIDNSPSMIEAAQKRMEPFQNQIIVDEDLTRSDWMKHIDEKVDVVISGFAIHHLTNVRKFELYKEIYTVLKPGGIFINLEHVKSESSLGNNLFDELMIDTLFNTLKKDGKVRSKEELMKEYLERPDQHDNILLPVGTQCEWLKGIGYNDVDCFFKCFEMAIFGGVR